MHLLNDLMYTARIACTMNMHGRVDRWPFIAGARVLRYVQYYAYTMNVIKGLFRAMLSSYTGPLYVLFHFIYFASVYCLVIGSFPRNFHFILLYFILPRPLAFLKAFLCIKGLLEAILSYIKSSLAVLLYILFYFIYFASVSCNCRHIGSLPCNFQFISLYFILLRILANLKFNFAFRAGLRTLKLAFSCHSVGIVRG
jgi:hypothetical protein